MTHSALVLDVTPCALCPLRQLEAFQDANASDVSFIQEFKAGEFRVSAGETIIREKEQTNQLFTVLSGWVFRYRTLEGTRRQIINFSLPGDFLGLQATLDDAMGHGVEALTDTVLCRFEREKLWTLYVNYPRLAFDITWLAAQQERSFEEHLMTLGQRNAFERVAFLLWHLYERGRDLGLVCGNTLLLPIRQQHIADTLGLSLVHTNKTLQRIREDGALELHDRSMTVLDEARLMRLGRVETATQRRRPLI